MPAQRKNSIGAVEHIQSAPRSRKNSARIQSQNSRIEVSVVTSPVHPAGVEPATFGSVDRCSIQLSYGCSLSESYVGGAGSQRIWRTAGVSRPVTHSDSSPSPVGTRRPFALILPCHVPQTPRAETGFARFAPDPIPGKGIVSATHTPGRQSFMEERS